MAAPLANSHVCIFRITLAFIMTGYALWCAALLFQARKPGTTRQAAGIALHGSQQRVGGQHEQHEQEPGPQWPRPPAPAMPAVSVHGARAANQQQVLVGIVGGSGQWPFWQAIKERRLKPQQPWHEQACTWNGAALACAYTVDPAQYAAADALYFHVPTHKSRILPKLHEQQLRVAISLESPAYYSWLNNPAYMCQFDIEATYRTCSQVQQTFHYEMLAIHKDLLPAGSSEQDLLHLPPLPFEKKKHAVAYLNSNCATLSPRQQVMQQWIMLGETGQAQTAVHSFGSCNNNMELQAGETKMHLFRRYKFCIAMENSISYEYITEKVWEALAAGCVPVYMGSPTIFEVVPEPNSIIVYGPGGNASSVEQLDELLHKLGSDPAAYNSLLAWKQKPLSQLSPGYQRYHTLNAAGSNECRLCQLVMQHRQQGGSGEDQWKTCLENATWVEAAGMKQVADCSHIRADGRSSSSRSSSRGGGGVGGVGDSSSSQHHVLSSTTTSSSSSSRDGRREGAEISAGGDTTAQAAAGVAELAQHSVLR